MTTDMAAAGQTDVTDSKNTVVRGSHGGLRGDVVVPSLLLTPNTVILLKVI